MQEVRLTTWQAFEAWSAARDGWAFRGEKSASWALLSSLARRLDFSGVPDFLTEYRIGPSSDAIDAAADNSGAGRVPDGGDQDAIFTYTADPGTRSATSSRSVSSRSTGRIRTCSR